MSSLTKLMNISPITDRSTLEDTLALVNPLPPPPVERDAILQLLKGDQGLIEALEKERIRRQSVLTEYQSKAIMEAACLEIVKADLARAQQFHEHIENTNKEAVKFTTFALQEARDLAKSSTQIWTRVKALNRAKISTVATSYHGNIIRFSQEAAESLRKASLAVQSHQEAFQAARTLVQMTRKDLDTINHQLSQLQDAVIRKKFMLQAIWRVPDDVWITIFAYSTGTAIGETGRDNGWLRDDITWYSALVISAVCRRWRIVATTSPRLWSNIIIVKGGFKKTTITRINHYLILAQKVPKTLLIDNPNSAEPVDTPQWRMTWRAISSVDKIVCRLQESGSNEVTSRVLGGLPGATTLWLLRASESNTSAFIAARNGPSYFLSIPASFCGVLKHLVTESVKIKWNHATMVIGWGITTFSSKRAQLLSYTVDCPPVESMWPIDIFTPDSVPTMVDLRIRTAQRLEPNPVLGELVALTRVTNLHTSISYLFGHISRRFSLPALTSLTIVDAGDTTVEQYEAIKPWFSSTRIKSMVCESMRDTGPLPSLIVDLDALSSLELQGEAVTSILSSLAQCCGNEVAKTLPSLTQLLVSSYVGDGSPILAFLNAWKDQDKSSPHLRTLNVAALADECPGLSLEVRKEIISLAQRRDRCESPASHNPHALLM